MSGNLSNQNQVQAQDIIEAENARIDTKDQYYQNMQFGKKRVMELNKNFQERTNAFNWIVSIFFITLAFIIFLLYLDRMIPDIHGYIIFANMIIFFIGIGYSVYLYSIFIRRDPTDYEKIIYHPPSDVTLPPEQVAANANANYFTDPQSQSVNDQGQPMGQVINTQRQLNSQNQPMGQPKMNSQGQLVNDYGQFVNAQGKLVNSKGQFVNAQGQLVNEQGQFVNAQGQIMGPPRLNAQGQLVNDDGLLVNEKGQLVNSKGQLINTQGQLVNEQGQYLNAQGQIMGPPRLNSEGRFVNDDGQLVNEQGRLVNEKGQLINVQGQLVNEQGQLVDEQGQLVDEQGQLVDEQGQLVDEQGQLVNEQGQTISNITTTIPSLNTTTIPPCRQTESQQKKAQKVKNYRIPNLITNEIYLGDLGRNTIFIKSAKSFIFYFLNKSKDKFTSLDGINFIDKDNANLTAKVVDCGPIGSMNQQINGKAIKVSLTETSEGIKEYYFYLSSYPALLLPDDNFIAANGQSFIQVITQNKFNIVSATEQNVMNPNQINVLATYSSNDGLYFTNDKTTNKKAKIVIEGPFNTSLNKSIYGQGILMYGNKESEGDIYFYYNGNTSANIKNEINSATVNTDPPEPPEPIKTYNFTSTTTLKPTSTTTPYIFTTTTLKPTTTTTLKPTTTTTTTTTTAKPKLIKTNSGINFTEVLVTGGMLITILSGNGSGTLEFNYPVNFIKILIVAGGGGGGAWGNSNNGGGGGAGTVGYSQDFQLNSITQLRDIRIGLGGKGGSGGGNGARGEQSGATIFSGNKGPIGLFVSGGGGGGHGKWSGSGGGSGGGGGAGSNSAPGGGSREIYTNNPYYGMYFYTNSGASGQKNSNDAGGSGGGGGSGSAGNGVNSGKGSTYIFGNISTNVGLGGSGVYDSTSFSGRDAGNNTGSGGNGGNWNGKTGGNGGSGVIYLYIAA